MREPIRKKCAPKKKNTALVKTTAKGSGDFNAEKTKTEKGSSRRWDG